MYYDLQSIQERKISSYLDDEDLYSLEVSMMVNKEPAGPSDPKAI
jgi:hypothetical protein